MKENAAACHLVGLERVGYGQGRLAYEPHVAVHTAMIAEVESRLLLSRRISLVVAVVGLHRHYALVARLYALFGQVDGYGQISAQMLFHFSAVDIHLLLAHNGLKVQRDVLALHVGRHGEMLAIPGNALIVAASACLGRLESYAVRGAHHLPTAVVKVGSSGTLGVAKMKAPALVEVVDNASAALQGE